MKPTQIVHLLSGGLDSVTLLYDLHSKGHSVFCLLCDYKQRHVQELLFAKTHCRRLGVRWCVIDLPALGGLTEKSWIVPNRNAILLAFAVNKAIEIGANYVTIGCNAEDEWMFPDCSKRFIEATNKVAEASRAKVKVLAPYVGWTKAQIATKFKTFRVPLGEVWSCYKGGAKPCGKCQACRKMKEAVCGR